MLDLKNKSKKPQGFTLIEVLLVVFLIGILATAAITSYVNSTTTFKFLSSYQQVTSALRTARSNALSNEQQGGVMPKRYGVCISKKDVTTFADTGDKEFKYDLLDPSKAGGCRNNDIFAQSITNEDTKSQDKSFDFASQGYELGVVDIELPVLIFYESGTGNLTAINGKNVKIDKTVNKYLNVSVAQKDGDLKKYIRIYQISGLVEESPTL